MNGPHVNNDQYIINIKYITTSPIVLNSPTRPATQPRFLTEATSAYSYLPVFVFTPYLVLSVGVALRVAIDVSSAQQQCGDDDHHPLR